MDKHHRFSKRSPKHRREFDEQDTSGFGQSLVNTEDLVPKLSALLESKSELEWAIRESTSDGPPHRQLRNAIILNQLAEIIEKIKVKGTSETISVVGTSPKEYGFSYPIGIPEDIKRHINDDKQKEAMDWMGEGPFHEVSQDILLMNGLSAINKAIDSIEKTSGIDSNDES